MKKLYSSTNLSGILKSLLTLTAFFIVSIPAHAQDTLPVIPQPISAERAGGHFALSSQTAVVAKQNSMYPAARFLQKQLLRLTEVPLAMQTKAGASSIHFELNRSLRREAYALRMDTHSVRISASDPAGWLYGAVSFLQLAATAEKSDGTFNVPNWKISDRPALGWRGIMLDESRHFFGREKVKSILDWMAFYKLNRFHWHLTDEPAWRLEIKKYPLLTLVGGIGSFSDAKRPAAYYSQQDIHEIVTYAAERNIEVIPEIDMPGHATAANRAYPQFSGGGTDDHPNFTFNPGKEETYTFLANILRETNTLFPSGMLHLGGDEVHFGNAEWKTNPDIQALMSKEGLDTILEVEHHFMNRMANVVYDMNSKLLVWDDLAEAGLPTEDTIMFWWRHDKPEQLRKSLANGYQTVLCPRLPLYFDFVQNEEHRFGRKWDGNFNPLENVYGFDAEAAGAGLAGNENIIGIQANLWSETLSSEQRLDYMLFPRIAALSEAAWTPSSRRNFEHFRGSLNQHLPLYRAQDIYFYNPLDPTDNPEAIIYRTERDLSIDRI